MFKKDNRAISYWASSYGPPGPLWKDWYPFDEQELPKYQLFRNLLGPTGTFHRASRQRRTSILDTRVLAADQTVKAQSDPAENSCTLPAESDPTKHRYRLRMHDLDKQQEVERHLNVHELK